MNESDLRVIESLCVSGRCVGETRQDLESVKLPLRIEIMAQGTGRVGQYFGLESVGAVESKLAQYPRGTRFVLYAPEEVADRVRRFAEERGLVVEMVGR